MHLPQEERKKERNEGNVPPVTRVINLESQGDGKGK
jgi:hypothetical protein